MPFAAITSHRPRRRCHAAAVMLWAWSAHHGAMAAPGAPDSRSPIHLHRIGTGDVEGLKKGIALMVEACRAVKGLPLGAPFQMPSDTFLAGLAIAEEDEYFDGANHASYATSRMVSADPRSGSCELRLFHERHAWAGQECGNGTLGSTTLMGHLIDASQPEPPNAIVKPQAASRAGCGRPAHAYDADGLAREDAGLGVRCVWHSDVIAKSMRAVGMQAKGHDPDSPAMDFCLYDKQPTYVFNGHRETVVLKSRGGKPDDVMNRLMGLDSGYLNHRLVDFSDGPPIPAERFSADAVRRFVEQPQITGLDGKR